MTEPTAEQREALKIAGELIDAGIPVFTAAPKSDQPGEFLLPKAWEQTKPDRRILDRWRPGWALAAVGGQGADFLDIDPRHGGRESEKELRQADHWPRTFGTQSTPSGGEHHILAPTGERKKTGFMPGVDLQAGGPLDSDGRNGRGFVYIAPTVRPSKAVETLGQMTAYRWVQVPDTAALAEYSGTDDSTEGILLRVSASRETQAARPESSQTVREPGGDSSLFDRPYTRAEAERYCAPALTALRTAQDGEINKRLNIAALTLGHFTPAFWSESDIAARCEEALTHTEYDGRTWNASDTIASALRKAASDWGATLRITSGELARVFDIPGEEETPVPASPEDAQNLVAKLLGQMLTAEQMSELPNPAPLVWELLDRDSLAALTGAPGSFKSFVALDIAAHVSRGTPWHGLKTHKGPVIYIAAEGARGMTMRIRAWRKRNGEMGDEIRFLPAPVQIRDAPAWQALVKACHLVQPVLVVVDTQAMVSVGMEENSNNEMGVAMEAFKRIQRVTGACVLAVHHLTKDGASTRGAGAQDGAQDTRIRVDRLTPRSGLKVRLRDEKQKDMAESDEAGLTLRLSVIELGEDPITGRRLSSLVVDHDAFTEAAGEERTEDVGQARTIREPQDWTARITRPDALVQRRILQTLQDLAPADVGLTEAKVRTLVAERWHDGKVGRRQGMLNSQSFADGWKKALELKIDTGESVVVPMSGQRYGLDPLVSDSI